MGRKCSETKGQMSPSLKDCEKIKAFATGWETLSTIQRTPLGLRPNSEGCAVSISGCYRKSGFFFFPTPSLTRSQFSPVCAVLVLILEMHVYLSQHFDSLEHNLIQFNCLLSKLCAGGSGKHMEPRLWASKEHTGSHTSRGIKFPQVSNRKGR